MTTAHRAVRGGSTTAGWRDRLIAVRRQPRRCALAAILAVNAALGVCDLPRMGLQNTFYAAAAWSGSLSWHAFFFAGLDPVGGATVDKPPLALWVEGLSVRLWGLNSWALLLPQVLMGVGCSALLYLTVRRLGGATAGLVAAAAMTVTPVAVWMFKSDNPDPLMVLLLVASAYCLVRALDDASLGWMAACGAAVGSAFEAKMLEAVLIVPALALTFVVCAGGTAGRRLVGLLAAAAAMTVTGLWWMVVVQLTPPGRRPYVSGSNVNSVFDLAFGYNGAQRVRIAAATLRTSDRLFVGGMGPLISFLLPAALVGIPVLLLATRGGRRDRLRAAGILFGGWLVVGGITLTYSNGIINTYYVLVIAPAIAALVGLAATHLWTHRLQPGTSIPLTLMVAATAGWGAVALGGGRHPRAVALECVLAGAGLVLLARLLGSSPPAAQLPGRRAEVVTGAALVAALLLPTTSAALAQVGTVHEPKMTFSAQPALLRELADAPAGSGFAAAVEGGRQAADLELQTRRAVLDIGGYHGDEVLPGLAELERMTRNHQIRYFVRALAAIRTSRVAVRGRSGSPTAVPRRLLSTDARFASWVEAHYRLVYADRSTDLYDLDRPLTGSPTPAVALVGAGCGMRCGGLSLLASGDRKSPGRAG